MHAIKNILFDLDGTLIESEEGILNSVFYALKMMNIVENNPESLGTFIGPPLSDSFSTRYHLSPQQTAAAVWHYRVFFKKTGILQNYVYAGIPQLLYFLKNEGFKLFIATSKPGVFTRQILDRHNLTPYFHDIQGSNLDNSLKDKNDIIRTLMERNHLKGTESVMVGDRHFDIRGAQANRCSSIGVTYGHGSRKELQKAGADYIADSPDQIPAFVKTISDHSEAR